MYSLAFDLGTTTLVGYLLDMSKAETVSTLSQINPQVEYGADVLSRVTFMQESGANKDILSSCLGEAIERMSLTLLKQVGISFENSCIGQIVLVGNPVIMGSIASYEFKLPVVLVPPIGNYVGADALVGAYIVEKERQDVTTDKKDGLLSARSLLVDIGTNTEIVLLSDNGKFATSAAAGPALEGGNISCGMIGKRGAVDKVTLTKTVSGEIDIITHVIGEIPIDSAEGMCGSGLIDLLACLLECKVIDNTGYLYSKTEALAQNCPKKIAGRIIELAEPSDSGKNGRGFRLTDKIVVTREDIRALQLAISAIRSGIEMLFLEEKLTDTVIDNIYLAGAFGNHIDTDSALRVGLLPDFDRAKIRQAGNLAGLGACAIASGKASVSDVIKLKNEIKVISLESKKEFRDMFMKYMNFCDSGDGSFCHIC